MGGMHDMVRSTFFVLDHLTCHETSDGAIPIEGYTQAAPLVMAPLERRFRTLSATFAASGRPAPRQLIGIP